MMRRQDAAACRAGPTRHTWNAGLVLLEDRRRVYGFCAMCTRPEQPCWPEPFERFVLGAAYGRGHIQQLLRAPFMQPPPAIMRRRLRIYVRLTPPSRLESRFESSGGRRLEALDGHGGRWHAAAASGR